MTSSTIPVFESFNEKTLVCVQGLGFVGVAMATAVSCASDVEGTPSYRVVGVDLDNEVGREKVDAINSGRLPLITKDEELLGAFKKGYQQGNLKATTNPEIYAKADIIVVDIHLDVVELEDGRHSASFGGFKKGIQTIGQYIKPGALVIVETTVPPGTCEKVVQPTLSEELIKRGLSPDCVHIAHSYERVMPGKDYYKSIVNFWRVYSGMTTEAADKTEAFLSKVINVKDYPLTRLHSTTASETAKVLENSYRATNIAFIQEWGNFAEAVGVDLFQVLDAIRVRPTHSNIRQPGFGVGGYCLTKDPHFVDIGARELFNIEGMSFPFSQMAIKTNNSMPLTSLNKLKGLLGDSLENKSILLLGVSYRQDVGDTRYSPSEIFVTEAENQGAKVVCHDPLFSHWNEMNRRVETSLPSSEGFDAIVLAVPHEEYAQIEFSEWLNGTDVVILDANNVLNSEQIDDINNKNSTLEFIGKSGK